MKIGIIIYSQTGNTYSVAEKLRDKLILRGHLVNIERIEINDIENQMQGNFSFKHIPITDGYDAVIFCSPVQAFSLSPVMVKYLSQITSLKEVLVGAFVTQHFPYPWMGGNNAIRKMESLCNNKEGTLIRTGIINWSNRNREKMIERVIDSFDKVFVK